MERYFKQKKIKEQELPVTSDLLGEDIVAIYPINVLTSTHSPLWVARYTLLAKGTDMSIAFLGLGSNLGNRKQNINKALSLITELGIIILTQSTIIETDPVGGPLQGKFLNAVIKIHTTLPPFKLLQKIKRIEKLMGRVKTVTNGPRIIDIDILLYEDRKIKTDDLIIPHPRMFERDFVMQPLKEIEPKIMTKKFSHNIK